MVKKRDRPISPNKFTGWHLSANDVALLEFARTHESFLTGWESDDDWCGSSQYCVLNMLFGDDREIAVLISYNENIDIKITAAQDGFIAKSYRYDEKNDLWQQDKEQHFDALNLLIDSINNQALV